MGLIARQILLPDRSYSQTGSYSQTDIMVKRVLWQDRSYDKTSLPLRRVFYANSTNVLLLRFAHHQADNQRPDRFVPDKPGRQT